jgi:hypothetical protein
MQSLQQASSKPNPVTGIAVSNFYQLYSTTNLQEIKPSQKWENQLCLCNAFFLLVAVVKPYGFLRSQCLNIFFTISIRKSFLHL